MSLDTDPEDLSEGYISPARLLWDVMYSVIYRILDHQPGAKNMSFHGVEEWWLVDTDTVGIVLILPFLSAYVMTVSFGA